MRYRAWRGVVGTVMIIAAGSAGAQTPPKRPAVSPPLAAVPPKRPAVNPPMAAIPPLTPAQQAAVLLGRWETCIDLSAQFLAYSALGARKSTANVERKCAGFEGQLRPVLMQSLREMMYGSSDSQVAAQTEVALGSLRRHIHARAKAAVASKRAQ